MTTSKPLDTGGIEVRVTSNTPEHRQRTRSARCRTAFFAPRRDPRGLGGLLSRHDAIRGVADGSSGVTTEIFSLSGHPVTARDLTSGHITLPVRTEIVVDRSAVE